jgi:hypothetical protein
MTAITAASAASPDAIVALPGQAPVQQPATRLRPGGRDGPLRNGNPRGNPHLAPRCGAKARTTGCACRAPAMANGRCRSHGRKSTGPRTPEGRASVARANTTHGDYAQAGPGAELRVHTRWCMVVARRNRLAQALTRHLRWLPRALAERVLAYEVPELRAPMHYTQFQDAPPGSSAPPGQDARWQALVGQALVGQAACKAGRDARGRFAALPPPVLRGREAELAWAHAEAAALAPWRAALARARMIKRLMNSQDRAARGAKLGQDAMQPRPPGACPGGGTVGPGGATGAGSDTNSMNSGAGGGTARARAEAPAAAVARKDAAACEGSDTNSMNSGAGGGMAGARAEAPAAAVAPKDGAARAGSDTNSMNSGAGGGTAACDAILAALPNRAARRRWKSLQRRKDPAPGQSGERKEGQGSALKPARGPCPLDPH